MITQLRNNLIVLKHNRIWVEGEDSFKTLTWLIRFICLVNLLITNCGMVIEIYFAKENVLTVTYCISLVGATGPCYAIYYCMIKWGPVLKKILKNLESELVTKYEIDEEEKKYIVEAEGIITKKFRKYIYITFMGLLGLVGIPFMKKIVMLLGFIPEGPVGTPEPTWTPFDIEQNYYNYYLVCFSQGYHLSSIWSLWVGSDVLFGGILFHLCGHLSIISDRMKLWISSRTNKYEALKGKKADLRNIVTYHVEVLNLCKDLNESVNLYHLYQLFFLAIFLCSCGMQIMKSSKQEATQIPVMLIFFVCMTGSWLAVCFMGTTIIIESQKVGQSIYFSDWILLPNKERKNLLFILSRCQRPPYMTAGKFFKISLSTFLEMVKASYSLLAILREVYG